MARIVVIRDCEYLEVSAAEMHTLENALIVSANRFDEDAKVCREAKQERIAEQFDQQAKDTRALHDALTK